MPKYLSLIAGTILLTMGPEISFSSVSLVCVSVHMYAACMYVRVCLSVCRSLCVYMEMYLSAPAFRHICLTLFAGLYIWVDEYCALPCVCVYVFVCMSACVPVCVCVCVCVCLCVCLCVYVYVYVFVGVFHSVIPTCLFFCRTNAEMCRVWYIASARGA